MSNAQTVFQKIDPKRFLAALLLDEHGETVARYQIAGLDIRTQQAPLDVATRVLNYPKGLQILEMLQESIFYDMDGRRLICRVIHINEHPYLLIVLTPANSAYRRALSQLIRQLTNLS
ncbi:MAG: hypothetical protein CUN55_01085 [Phototrophicales bacterium]|nr:MAG: hypothetical protein CUN55_01085 [Phototrophicales bacterium]